MTKEEVIKRVIWEDIMEATAHTGWTDKARLSLVKLVQDSVMWAYNLTPEQLKEHSETVEYYDKESEDS